MRRKAVRGERGRKKKASVAAGAARVALTQVVQGGGCACKVGPGELSEALSAIQQAADERLLAGADGNEDAGVFRVRSDMALVNTVDFFPPLVDDPFTFGQIAAANALSDVYAMGGRPMTCLNIVAWPGDDLGSTVLSAILAGGVERANAAGAVVVGGHTISDPELKYGMAVTGLVHPERFVRNVGARKGDLLVLTKPLGTGILATGIKRRATEAAEENAAVASMVALNDVAGSMLRRFRARACTDVTGFGLAGHAAEMAAGTQVRLEFDAGCLGLLPGTARLAESGCLTGGSRRNRAYLGAKLAIARDVEAAIAEAFIDPQTSGGLLVSMPAAAAREYVEALHARGIRPAIVGRVAARPARSGVLVALA